MRCALVLVVIFVVLAFRALCFPVVVCTRDGKPFLRVLSRFCFRAHVLSVFVCSVCV